MKRHCCIYLKNRTDEDQMKHHTYRKMHCQVLRALHFVESQNNFDNIIDTASNNYNKGKFEKHTPLSNKKMFLSENTAK